jgi:hypothetical protein
MDEPKTNGPAVEAAMPGLKLKLGAVENDVENAGDAMGEKPVILLGLKLKGGDGALGADGVMNVEGCEGMRPNGEWQGGPPNCG